MKFFAGVKIDFILSASIFFLILMSVLVLRSVSPEVFPSYFIFIAIAAVVFLIFSRIDFDVLEIFSSHLYFISLFLLFLPLIIGRVTRGAVRWIPIGNLTLQPSEIVRPFLLLYSAKLLTAPSLDTKAVGKAIVALLIPALLIAIQPSLGVAILTCVGFLGVLLSANIEKRLLFVGLGIMLSLLPVFWVFLQPYQKQRITGFFEPGQDPLGAGYNSIQSMIAVGSGEFFGRGLGEGVQTQLKFLPEKHTDFIFAATAEEMGFAGALLTVVGLFILLWRLTTIVESSRSPTARAYVSGVFLTLFAETLIHVGMNMGLLPITGIPLPLISAGGSSLMGTMISLGIAASAKK